MKERRSIAPTRADRLSKYDTFIQHRDAIDQELYVLFSLGSFELILPTSTRIVEDPVVL